MQKCITILFGLVFFYNGYSQSVQDLINRVNVDSLELTVAELSGEQPTIVNGVSQTISSRIESNNDLAADYIKAKLESFPNLSVEFQEFNTNGKNIIATQIGQSNPEDIYIVCAHYDSVAAYCADDNATGTAAVLEMARILSTQCTENTIVYALWDEEEIGLRGAGYFANLAADETNGNTRDNILAVINMDMMGYDGDAPGSSGDNEFDIDVRPIANSLEIVSDLEDIMNTYSFNLKPIVVNPGTPASDHKRFWDVGYSAVLVGESWETDDQTPFYHSANDRLATLDLPYFHEITKLIMAYTATKAGIELIDSTVNLNGPLLTANESNAVYQWINCDTGSSLLNETNQSFSPLEDGNYAVEITKNGCSERSLCTSFSLLSLGRFDEDTFHIFPNPADKAITIETELNTDFGLDIELYNDLGKSVLKTNSQLAKTKIPVQNLSSGLYFLSIKTNEKSGVYKIIVD